MFYLLFFFSGIEMPFIGKEKAFKHSTQNSEFFQHMLLKFEIIRTRISQVI